MAVSAALYALVMARRNQPGQALRGRKTDFVMTYPTRQHYVTGGNQPSDSIVAPFANSCPFGDQLAGETGSYSLC